MGLSPLGRNNEEAAKAINLAIEEANEWAEHWETYAGPEKQWNEVREQEKKR